MTITPLRDILFGEQNAISVNKRSLVTDDELMRRARTDYISSRDLVDNSGYMTARVIETPAGEVSPPFSWSSLSARRSYSICGYHRRLIQISASRCRTK